MNPINLYSNVLVGVVLFALAALVLLRGGDGASAVRPYGGGIRRGRLLALAGVGLGLLVVWWIVRPVQSSYEDIISLRSQIGSGTPVLLEIQSPYCMACTLARPVVDRIERDHAGKLIVVRLDIQVAEGRLLANEFMVRATPTFIFFDAQGQEAWRSVSTVDPQRVSASLGD